MRFSKIVPFLDFNLKISNCDTHEDFVLHLFQLLKIETLCEREKEAVLSALMAYRDHYPLYMIKLGSADMIFLNTEIAKAPARIIKLRRIAISEIAKAA